MPHNDDLFELRCCSLDRLLGLAFERTLFKDYRLAPSFVELSGERHSVKMDPEEARWFLIKLLGAEPHPLPVDPQPRKADC